LSGQHLIKLDNQTLKFAIARFNITFNITIDISIFGKKITLTIKIAEAGDKDFETLAGQKKLRLEVLSSLNFMK
jgi:hypothetical protein